MAQFNGSQTWPTADMGKLSPAINIIYDTSITGFRCQTQGDTSFTFSSGTSVVAASGSTINIINTGLSFFVNGTAVGSIPVNVSGTVTTPISTFNIPNVFVPSGGLNGIALAANPNRKTLFVQNLGVNPLYVKFGAAGASDSSMSVALGGGTLSGDGKGGVFIDEGCQVTGLISISGAQSYYLAWDV